MFDSKLLEEAARHILIGIGENPSREGLQDTPKRVAKAMQEMCSGYNEDPKEILSTVFTQKYDEMVLLKNVQFYSLCEHHMLIYSGKATLAYVPKGKVVGLSKLARLVDCFAKRLTIQEKLTVQITQALMDYLDPLGAACLVEAQHSCMACRGIKKAQAKMVTSSLRGCFEIPATRAEFLTLARD